MAKNLKTSVQLDTKQAVRSLDALEKKIRNVQRAINNQEAVTNKMVTTTNKLVAANNKVASSSNKVTSSHNREARSVSLLTTKVRRLANAYLGVLGAKAALTASDTITSAENKLNQLTGNPQVTQQVMDKMYSSAQNARMGYADMMSNVAKSMTLAPNAFGGNIDNAIRFQEIMGKAYTLGGASAAEMSSSMYQMIQALGSGKLQGDELRSVREGAPLAYQKIEEFAKGVYGANENLKDLASQGKITSDIVVAAIMSAGDEMDKSFEKTQMTFAQAWLKIKNIGLKSFEPVLQMLNDGLNSSTGQAILNGIGKAIQIVANSLKILFTLIGNIVSFVVDNWGIISKILLSIATIVVVAIIPKLVSWLSYLGFIITYYAYVGSASVAAALKSALAWAAANLPLLLIIATLAAIVITIIWVSDSFVDACGIIVGATFALGATIWNIVVGLVNGVIQFLWTSFVEPWISIIEWVLNVFNGGFNSFGDGVKNLLGNIISWFLSLGTVVTKIIDAIFGTNWTGGLNALKDNILSWGKNEKAITLDRKAPEALKRIDTKVAYDTGYNYGAKAGNWITNKLSSALPNIGLNTSDVNSIVNGVGAIGEDTGKMAKSMELTAEDLEFLRKVAEMEWKKEFTTATIQVDMSNYNTVNGDSDLDGIVTKLTDKLYEELSSVANGVYA